VIKRAAPIGHGRHDYDEVDRAFIDVIALKLTEELFRQIAGARRVRFQLPARRRLERELRPVHINCFKSFLETLEQEH
jgi:hypothetical protein